MSEKHLPIPSTTKLIDENGLISSEWRQFLTKIFGDIYKNTQALETDVEDHESRISALES